ncbi:MAG: uridine kinase family protein [Anaerolineae bacterium]
MRLTLPGGLVLSAPKGTSLEAFALAWQRESGANESPVVAITIEGDLLPLTFVPDRDAVAVPVGLGNIDGMRIYKRSLSLVLVLAAKRLFPGAQISVDHSITANGVFCTVSEREPLSPAEVKALADEMCAIVQANLPIVRRHIPRTEAIALFAAEGYDDKVRLLRFQQDTATEVYELAGLVDSFYGYLVPSTGYLERFRLQHADDGFTLMFPLGENPSEYPADSDFPKLMNQFREARRWLSRVGAEDAGALNAAIDRGSLRELVLTAEALHERRISEVAVAIAQRPSARLVFIAGPTSSGKTTFAKRLGIQLAASGLRSYAISLDDYFVDRSATPRDEAGELDFEAFDALDYALFNDHMARLLRGETVRLPKYDFLQGARVPGPSVDLHAGTVLLVEGLHGLNPNLLPGAPADALFRVYVSCLAQINIDRHNHIPTSDSRLLRRIVRDAVYRGYTAEKTIVRWQSVRRGERRFVFPYQELADFTFNTALAYETAVLKPLAEPLLLPFDHSSVVSVEVQRLLTLLSLFLPADGDVVPDNSLLREFVGGSIFERLELTGQSRS